MTKPFEEWTVLPHGQLTRLAKNLLSVAGTVKMPLMGEVTRRMTVVRLEDGRLVIYSAIALDEAEMQALERFGTPAFLIVPNGIHRLDAKTWKERYPALKVVAPLGAHEKASEVVPVDAVIVDFGDPSVTYFTIDGTAQREAALLVKTESGTTLVLSDLIFDLANRPGIKGWLFKLLGMTGDEPHIPAPIKMREVKDESALRSELERLARVPQLNRVIIAHGNIIGGDAPQVLEKIAASLDS